MKFNAGRQSFSVTVIGSGLLSVLFAVRYFTASYPFEQPVATGMPLAAWLTRFSIENPVWSSVIVFILLMWMSYIMIQLTVRYASATSRNYLPIVIFTVAACGIFIPAEALASYTAAFLLVLATRQFVSAFRKDMRFEEAFRGGFYLGLIPLLYAPCAILLILIPILMSLYRRSSRELIVSIIGAILPTAGAWFILWASGKGVWFLFTEFWRTVSGKGIFFSMTVPVTALVCIVLIAVLSLMAVGWFLANRKGMRTRQRKVMAHISFTLLLLSLSLVVPGSSLSALPLLAVPAAMAVPYAFTGKQASISSVAYLLLIAAVLALNLFPLSGNSIL